MPSVRRRATLKIPALMIPCGSLAIRVQRVKSAMQDVKYRAACTVRIGEREFGKWSLSLMGAVADLLPKLKLKQQQKEAVMAEVLRCPENVQPAISHSSRLNASTDTAMLPPAVAFFKKHPFEGVVRTRVREADGKVRMLLSRLDGKVPFEPRMASNWHATSEEAFACIRLKCLEEGRDVPAMSHMRSDEPGVKFVHQVFGLYKDGKPMSALFTLSSCAWQAYAKQHQCVYKLWTADDVDTLIQLEAPEWVQTLYRNVEFPVQRVDVCRFYILFKYGGLYADLDVFPNLATFPLVPLGMCKVLARKTRTMRHRHEWEIELLVAIAGNRFLLAILQEMVRALAEKSDMGYYKAKPCRFIYHTTGPKGVGKTLRTYGYEPHVTVFSMCRPVPDLEKHLSLDDEGRVRCHLPRLEQYNVWSAFSMSYKGMLPRAPPPLARPLAQLPPFPAKKPRRRYSIKTTEAPADGIDEQAIADDKPPSKTEPGNEVKEEKQSDDEPQQMSLHSGNIPQEAREALADIGDLLLPNETKSPAVRLCFALLRRKTCKYLQKLEKRRT